MTELWWQQAIEHTQACADAADRAEQYAAAALHEAMQAIKYAQNVKLLLESHQPVPDPEFAKVAENGLG